MSEKTKRKRWRVRCKICGTYNGVMKHHGFNICWRCFKQNAERLGFRKYD